MKNCFLFLLCWFCLSCNDGNLDIETIDFDSVKTVKYCNTLSTTSKNLLFKINAKEALIVELQAGLLKNEISTEDLTSVVSTGSKVIYRIFSSDVSANYFCDDIPAVEPMVLDEIEAKNGTIYVNTTSENDTLFTHNIRLGGITFIKENGDRITNLEINNFGTVTTSL